MDASMDEAGKGLHTGHRNESPKPWGTHLQESRVSFNDLENTLKQTENKNKALLWAYPPQLSWTGLLCSVLITSKRRYATSEWSLICGSPVAFMVTSQSILSCPDYCLRGYFFSPLFNQVGELRTSSHLQLQSGQEKAKQFDTYKTQSYTWNKQTYNQ